MNEKARGEGLEIPGSVQVVLTLVILAATTVALRWLFFGQRKKPNGQAESKEMQQNHERKGRQGDQQEYSSDLPDQQEGSLSPRAPTSKVSRKGRASARSCTCRSTDKLNVNFECDSCQIQDVTQDWDTVPDKGSTGHSAVAKLARDRDPQEAIYSAKAPSALFPKQETVSKGNGNDLGLLRDSILLWPPRQTWGINNDQVKQHVQEGLGSWNFKASFENQPYLRSDSTREDDMELDVGALGNQSTLYFCEEVGASLGGRSRRDNEKLFTTVGIYKDDAKKLKTHLQPFSQDDTNKLLQSEQSTTQDSDLETCPKGTVDWSVEAMHYFPPAQEKNASFTMASISACLQNDRNSIVSNCDTDDHRNHRQSQQDPITLCGPCLNKLYQYPEEDILLLLSHAENSEEDRQCTMEIHSPKNSTDDSYYNSSCSETKSTAQNENPERGTDLLEWENICIAASSLNEVNLSTAASSGIELRNYDDSSDVCLNKQKQIQDQEIIPSIPDKLTKNKDGQDVAKYFTANMDSSPLDKEDVQLSLKLSTESRSIEIGTNPDYFSSRKNFLCPVNEDNREWRTEYLISSMALHEGQNMLAEENTDFSHRMHADLPCLDCAEVNASTKTIFFEIENSAVDQVHYQKGVTHQLCNSVTWQHAENYCTKDIEEVKEYHWAEGKIIWQSDQDISLKSFPEKETKKEEASVINTMSYTDSSTTYGSETNESGYTSENITPIREDRSWSSLETYSEEKSRVCPEQNICQQQMDCAVDVVNRCQMAFKEQCVELTIANNDQSEDDDNEENFTTQRNNMGQTKCSTSHSLFMDQSLEIVNSSSEILPYNTTDSFLQDVNEEETNCVHHLLLQGLLDIQLQDCCLEDKRSQHESSKCRKPSNESYRREARCMTTLIPKTVIKTTSKPHEQEHPRNNADLADVYETEDLMHSDCALKSDCEIKSVNNDGSTTLNSEIKCTSLDSVGITSWFQGELHKPNKTPQREGVRSVSLKKTWDTGNIIIIPSEGQEVDTCQHLASRLSEEPSARKITESKKTSFENRNRESHASDYFHKGLLSDETLNQTSLKLFSERISAEVPVNKTMTKEFPLVTIRYNEKKGVSNETHNMDTMASGFPASPEVIENSQNGFCKAVHAPMPLSFTVREDESMSAEIPWPASTHVISRALALSHNIFHEISSTTDASKQEITTTDSACIRTEARELTNQHALSLSSTTLTASIVQGKSKVPSGRYLLQRKGSMSEIAENPQLRFQVNSISNHKPKLSLVTRSCEDILSRTPREKINRRSKAQSMLCLLTEHYSQSFRGKKSLVEFVSKGSFIHIPEILQDTVDAMKLHLTLGNCMELLRFAKKHGAVDLQAAAYTVMSDNYLQVLRDPTLYGQLSGGERDRILQLRMRGRKMLGTVTLENIYDMRSSSQNQSCPLGNKQAPPSLTTDSRQKVWLYIFHLEENSWHPLIPVPEEASLKACGICSMHNYLFIAGGIQGQGLNIECTNKVFCYNPLTEIWSQLAPMNQARSQLKLVPVDGYLYAIGGECLYTVERYDPRFNKWTFRASLPKGSFAVAHEAANCNGDIYISGGNLFYRLFRYIPLKDLWEECPYNTSRKRSSDMVAVRSFLYRFDIHRDFGLSVFRYNTITRVWNECATLCLKTSPFRCTVLDDTIYCLNKKMIVMFLTHERPPRFESHNLCPFLDNNGRGVLYPFVLSLPQFGSFQTPV